jgi:hypothetical protein
VLVCVCVCVCVCVYTYVCAHTHTDACGWYTDGPASGSLPTIIRRLPATCDADVVQL